LDQLINHEWRTNLTLKTDANGKMSFRGFHGTYLVKTEKEKVKKEMPLELKSESNKTEMTIVLAE
jgi:hypothetical protein